MYALFRIIINNYYNDLGNKIDNYYVSNSNIGKGVRFGTNKDGSFFTLRPILSNNLFQLTKNDSVGLMNIDSSGNFSVNGELKGSSLNCPHTHSISGLSSGYISENISGYNGFRVKRQTSDGILEEFGRIYFSKIGFSQQFGYLYYNTAQPYSIPLGYSFNQVYDIHLDVICNGGLMGATVASWDTGHIKYWLYSGKNCSADLQLSYHIIGHV